MPKLGVTSSSFCGGLRAPGGICEAKLDPARVGDAQFAFIDSAIEFVGASIRALRVLRLRLGSQLRVVRLLRRCIEEQESNDGDRKDEDSHSRFQSLKDAGKEIGRLGRTAVIRPLFTPRSCLPFQLIERGSCGYLRGGGVFLAKAQRKKFNFNLATLRLCEENFLRIREQEHGERGEPVFARVVAAGDVSEGGGGVFLCGRSQDFARRIVYG